MIFVWCTCVYKCVHLFCTGAWGGQRTTSTVIPRALLAFTALLAFYLFSVCVQMHIPCHKYGRGAKRTGKWDQMAGFSTEGPTSHNQQHCKEESISKTWTDSWEWTLLERLLLQRSPKDRPSTERQWLTPWKQQWVLGTGSWALHSQRRVSAEDNDRRVRYSSAALKWWFHKNCSS